MQVFYDTANIILSFWKNGFWGNRADRDQIAPSGLQEQFGKLSLFAIPSPSFDGIILWLNFF